MTEASRMAKMLEQDARNHQGDMRILEMLSRLAKQGVSRHDCGRHFLDDMEGDLAKVKDAVEFMQTEMNQMLTDWYVGAVLAASEPKEMT